MKPEKISALIMLIVLSAALTTMPTLADVKDKKQDKTSTYKCHVLLDNKTEVIKDFRRLPEKYQQTLALELVGKTASANGNDKNTIVEVKECVLADKAFRTAQARELDRLTLR